jgi:hypothetical protein
VLPERVDRQPVDRLGQGAAAHQHIGQVEGDALLGRQVDGLEVRGQRGEPLGRHAFLLRDRDMRIDLIGRIEARADH